MRSQFKIQTQLCRGIIDLLELKNRRKQLIIDAVLFLVKISHCVY